VRLATISSAIAGFDWLLFAGDISGEHYVDGCVTCASACGWNAWSLARAAQV